MQAYKSSNTLTWVLVGLLLAEAGDSAYVDEMRFGYFVRAATDEGFTVKFDDMAIWLIEEE